MALLLSDALAEALRDKGYAIVDTALPPALAAALRQTSIVQLERNAHAAGIGRRQAHAVNQEIRGDHICWLSSEETTSAEYLSLMNSLRLTLNEALFLGLFSYEAHYACYPAGAFYRTHLDAFKGARSRLLSTVYYLNEDWPGTAGGELKLYAEDGTTSVETIQPLFNRLVVFLSEEFPHEVLPATRPRYSIAGWFKGLP